MTYKIKVLDLFLNQIKDLDQKSKVIIKEKIDLIKENPFRFKRIHSRLFTKVFRVRLNIQRKESRLIYVVLKPNVILVCLLSRKKDYKDLEKYLKKV